MISVFLWSLSSTQTLDDPDFPYVGKFIANLSLAQLKTLDCGSKRLDYYRTSAETTEPSYPSQSPLSFAAHIPRDEDIDLRRSVQLR